MRSASFSDVLPSAERTSSYSTSSRRPFIRITFSLLIGCLCIATSVPGSIAFSMRCEPSSADVLRSKFVLNRGFPFASSNSLSSYFWLIVILQSPQHHLKCLRIVASCQASSVRSKALYGLGRSWMWIRSHVILVCI